MKRPLIAAALALGMALAAVPTLAVPTSSLAGLARLYPESSFMYVGFRTDDAYIATLDSVIGRAATAAGIPTFTMGTERLLSDTLDQLAASVDGQGGTFASDIRPWLGDFGAFGVLSAEGLFDDRGRGGDSPDMLIAFETLGRDQAEAWIDARIPPSFTRTDDGDYTLYAPPDEREAWIYVGRDLMLISNTPSAFPQAEMRATLAEDASFRSALSNLPAADYNIISYVDSAASTAAMLAQMDSADVQNDPQAQQMLDSLQPALQALRGTALGFTLLDSDSLTVDIAVDFDAAALAQLDMQAAGSFPAVDPAFAARVPAGAPLVILGTNFAGSFTQSLEQQLMLFGTTSGADADQARQVLAAVRAGVQGVTGLPLEEVFAWATGQYALAASVDMSSITGMFAPSSQTQRNPLQLSLVLENVDGGAQALFDGLRRTLVGLDGREISVTDKEIVGGQAVNVTIAASRDVPFPIDLQMAITDDVLVLGTPDYVAAAIGASGGLNDDPAFARSFSTALPDTPAFLYLATGPLRDLLALFAMGAGGGASSASFEGVLNAFESMNISAATIGADNVAVRAVITLAP